MRTHTQLKIFFAGVLIALATLTTMTAPAQVMGGGQSMGPAAVALPSDARESGLALHPALPRVDSAEGIAVSHSKKRTTTLRAITPSSSLFFLPAVTYDSGGTSPVSVAVADLNGDGKPDLVVLNNGSIGVLLGNGDGTFQPAARYDSGGGTTAGGSVAIADVNNDGRPDLAVMNSDAGGGAVLLGNGDGTFQPAMTYYLGAASTGWAGSVAVADVNADGKPDLLVDLAACSTSVFVLLGNGDGTFASAECGLDPSRNYYSGGVGDNSIAAADLNGDGKPDVIAANGYYASANNVGVLLGNGDGTLQPVSTYSSGGLGPLSVAVADVNGDNKPDLVVANCGSGGCPVYGLGEGSVAVLLGNGVGTFQPAVAYDSAGVGAFAVAVADVNGDGKPDLVVANAGSNNIGFLLGNGDGSFQPAVSFASGGSYPRAIALADLNGDGKPDAVVVNSNDSTAGVLLNNVPFCTTPPVVTVSATPTSLWPPNGKMVPVTVSGTITDTGCTIATASYAVKDEYSEVQPSGAVTVGTGGVYSFVVSLEASRLGSDLDGRQYFVSVSATNNSGQTGSQTGIIIVPHDQRR